MTAQEEKILELVSSEDLTEMMIGVEMLKQYTALECWTFLNQCLHHKGYSMLTRYKFSFLSLYTNEFSGMQDIKQVTWEGDLKSFAGRNSTLKHDPSWIMKILVTNNVEKHLLDKMGIQYGWHGNLF